MKRFVTPRWGIRLFAVWAGVLTFLALARLLILTQSVELSSNAFGNQAAVWVIFGLNVSFGVGFGMSAYGLWMHHSWARNLFLWTIAIWAGFNIITIFIPGAYRQSSFGQQVLNGLRYAVALFIPVFYLNRSQVKAIFYEASQDSIVKDLDNV